MRFLLADLFIHLLALLLVHSFLHGGVLGLALPLASGGALGLGHGLVLVFVDSLAPGTLKK